MNELMEALEDYIHDLTVLVHDFDDEDDRICAGRYDDCRACRLLSALERAKGTASEIESLRESLATATERIAELTSELGLQG